MSRRPSRTYWRARQDFPTRCRCDIRSNTFLGSATLWAITLTLQTQGKVTLTEADNMGSGGRMTAHKTTRKRQGTRLEECCQPHLLAG